MAIDQLDPKFVAAYAEWLGVTDGEAYTLLKNEPLVDVTDEVEVTAAGFVEADHPRHPEGDERGGQFAPKGEETLADMEDRVGAALHATYDGWAQGLGKKERDAFQAWRSEVYYTDMNAMMRYGADYVKAKDWDKVYEFTETFRETMFNAPKLREPVRAYRGVDAGTLLQAAGVESVDDLVGKTMYDEGFRATTTVGGLEDMFGDTTIEITVPEGYPAIWAGSVEQAIDPKWLEGLEDWEIPAYNSELVLPPGGFKVKRVRRGGSGRVTIEAEATTPW